MGALRRSWSNRAQWIEFYRARIRARGALGVSDRGLSAASQIKPGDIDWQHLFGTLGVRWFHTGGIFAALSDTSPEVVLEAISAANEHGTIVSYDLNYRPSLWQAIGGHARAREVNRRIVKQVDVIIGNEEDFTACLGLEVEGLDEHISALDIGSYQRMIQQAVTEFPNFKVAATTLRSVKTATINDWSAIVWCDGQFHQAHEYRDVEVLDRVGGGDSFASGLVYGFLTTGDATLAVEYGTAHGALAMTTAGDTSMASLDEVEKLMRGGGARVVR